MVKDDDQERIIVDKTLPIDHLKLGAGGMMYEFDLCVDKAA